MYGMMGRKQKSPEAKVNGKIFKRNDYDLEVRRKSLLKQERCIGCRFKFDKKKKKKKLEKVKSTLQNL